MVSVTFYLLFNLCPFDVICLPRLVETCLEQQPLLSDLSCLLAQPASVPCHCPALGFCLPRAALGFFCVLLNVGPFSLSSDPAPHSLIPWFDFYLCILSQLQPLSHPPILTTCLASYPPGQVCEPSANIYCGPAGCEALCRAVAAMWTKTWSLPLGNFTFWCKFWRQWPKKYKTATVLGAGKERVQGCGCLSEESFAQGVIFKLRSKRTVGVP